MIKALIKLVTAIVLLFLASRNIHWSDLTQILSSTDTKLVFLAGIMIFVGQIMSAMRQWLLISEIAKLQMDFLQLFKVYFFGFLLNQLLPTGMGGDAYKVFKLKASLTLKNAISTTIVDRAWGVVIIFITTIALFPYIFELSGGSSLFVIAFFFSIIFLTMVPIFLRLSYLIIELNILRNRPFFLYSTKMLTDIFFDLTKTMKMSVLIITFLIHLCGILTFIFLYAAISGEWQIFEFFVFVPYIFVAALMPISFAGWGTREFAAIFVLNFLGVVEERAIVLSVSYGVISLAVALLGCISLILLLPEKLNRNTPRTGG